MNPVKSEMLSHVGYDPKTATLSVRYKASGEVYHHPGVPADKFGALMKAESLGKHFNLHIKKQHPGKKHQG